MEKEEKKKVEEVEKKEDTNKKVDEILRKAKEKGKITYGELASELGISQAQISRVEKKAIE